MERASAKQCGQCVTVPQDFNDKDQFWPLSFIITDSCCDLLTCFVHDRQIPFEHSPFFFHYFEKLKINKSQFQISSFSFQRHLLKVV